MLFLDCHLYKYMLNADIPTCLHLTLEMVLFFGMYEHILLDFLLRDIYGNNMKSLIKLYICTFKNSVSNTLAIKEYS